MSNITIPTFEQLVKTELAKYDSVIPKVEELKAEYLSLKISSIEDAENYQRVKDAIRFIVTKRVEIEEKRKELKADSLAYGKAVDARAREITALIMPIEEHLKEEKARIDAEIEQIKAKIEEEKQNKIKLRHESLIQAGMNRVANEYTWTNPNNQLLTESFAAVNLETLNDQDFESYVKEISKTIAEANSIYERELQKRQEQERSIAVEREKLAQAQRELYEEQERFRRENERMRKEMEELINTRTSERLKKLYDLGLVSITHLNAICYKRENDFIPLINYPTVRDASREEWEVHYAGVEKAYLNLKTEDDNLKALEIERLKRQALEAEEIKRKEIQEQQAKLEQERIAGLSDKDKLAEYCKKILEIPTPEMKTIKWKKELKVIHTTVVAYLQ